MALRCDHCDKGSDWGHNVSHAKNRTQRIRKPNLHAARVIEDGKVVKRVLCTKCLRAAKRPERKIKLKKESTDLVEVKE